MDVHAVRGLLKDVQLYGMIIVDERKLLFLLGRQYDKPSAWEELLSQWEEMGGKRADLRGGWVDGYEGVLLATKNLHLESVSDWTKE